MASTDGKRPVSVDNMKSMRMDDYEFGYYINDAFVFDATIVNGSTVLTTFEVTTEENTVNITRVINTKNTLFQVGTPLIKVPSRFAPIGNITSNVFKFTGGIAGDSDATVQWDGTQFVIASITYAGNYPSLRIGNFTYNVEPFSDSVSGAEFVTAAQLKQALGK